ncbi:MAG: hypothetical protein IPI52_14730 [Bacteroidetes bacterium]|nr:hypothetical protein [Bacteroidota bacterium]
MNLLFYMMGDNRTIPRRWILRHSMAEDHIVGKLHYLYSYLLDKNEEIKVSFLNRIRFKRFFKPIHGDAIENKNLF